MKEKKSPILIFSMVRPKREAKSATSFVRRIAFFFVFCLFFFFLGGGERGELLQL